MTIEPFTDVIGRQFQQPKEGLGYDNSPVAHMWRSMIRPDSPRDGSVPWAPAICQSVAAKNLNTQSRRMITRESLGVVRGTPKPAELWRGTALNDLHKQ